MTRSTVLIVTLLLIQFFIYSTHAGECHVHNRPDYLSFVSPKSDDDFDSITVSNFADNLAILLGLSPDQNENPGQPLLYSARPLKIPSSTWLFHVEGLERLFQNGVPLEDNREFDISSLQSKLLETGQNDALNMGTIIISSESDVQNLEQSLKNEIMRMDEQAPVKYLVIVCDFCQDDKFLQHLQTQLNSTIARIVANDSQALTMTLTTQQTARIRRARATNDGKSQNVTIATMYSDEYSSMFNIFFWTTLALALILITVIYIFLNMDPGEDTIIYRMTTPRLKVD